MNIETKAFAMKSFIWLGAGITAAALLAFAIAFLHASLEQERAERLLSIVTKFAVGKTTESTVIESVRPFLTGISSPGNQEAGGNHVSVIFDNIELARLRLSNYRRFTIQLRFHDHILTEKSASFFVDYDCRIKVVERTREEATLSPEPELNYRNHFSTVPSGYSRPVNDATIIDDDTYPESLRNQDWRFNLGQLKHFGGCSDVRAILPAISR